MIAQLSDRMITLFWTPFSALLVGVLIALCIVYKAYQGHKSRSKLHHDQLKPFQEIPGPESKWGSIGNSFLFWERGVPIDQAVRRGMHNLAEANRDLGMFKIRLPGTPMVFIYKAELVEPVLTSNTLLRKGSQYGLFENWLRKGLIVSSGEYWRRHRKILTPAFHFRILEDFIPTVNEHAQVFVNKLCTSNGESIDIREPCMSCSLDIICDAAMGIKLNAQSEDDLPYCKALSRYQEIQMERIWKPWTWSEFIFRFLSQGIESRRLVETLHGFTRSVFGKRRSEFLNRPQPGQIVDESPEESLTKSRKGSLVFMDLLLHYHLIDKSLSEDEVCEEIDNFMFAGHDTTGWALVWCLYEIARNESVQKELHQELDRVLGPCSEDPISASQLRELTYLEQVIKENLRHNPPVPIIGRELEHEIRIGDYLVPKGVSVWLMLDVLHTDPRWFGPNPLEFNPDHFSKNRNDGRHPFAYVPFSAGPRSCIGQRFAMIKEKILVASILRKFELKTETIHDEIYRTEEVVLKSKTPIRISFLSRKPGVDIQ